jgi:hypothetical protein
MSTSCGRIAASVMKDGCAHALDAANGSCRWQFPAQIAAISRLPVVATMVPGILRARTGQKTTNKYVMVPIVYRPDQRRTYTIARLHN